MTQGWWQWSGVGAEASFRQLLGRRGDAAPAVRYTEIEPFVVGQSPYLSYQRIFGNTQFCAPVPRSAPDAQPSNRYIAGEYLLPTSINNYPGSGYAATFNTWQYNLSTYVVDSSLPPGPVGEGGGGYEWQKVWQKFQNVNYRTKRGGGLYQPMTDNLPLPIDAQAAPGTDASMSMLDVNGFKCIDFWKFVKSDGTFKWAAGVDTDPGSGFDTTDFIPAGEWTYWTCGVAPDTRVSNGAFPPGNGNVVASSLMGMALQIGLSEALAASGLRVKEDGTIAPTRPVTDAIQHMIGIELAATVAEGSAFSWPATFSDASKTPANEIVYGQRLFFDLDAVDLDAVTDPLTKALVWTGGTYGFTITDKGGNFAFRGEPWRNPGDGSPNPWDAIFEKSGGKLATIKAMPWDRLRSLPRDYVLDPIGVPA